MQRDYGRPVTPPLHRGVAQIEEVLVNAQKHSESINSVGMPIKALSGEQLGVTNVADLALQNVWTLC